MARARSEVAKFCQKYMAKEMTRLQQYHEGNLPDSLIEVCHIKRRLPALLEQPFGKACRRLAMATR